MGGEKQETDKLIHTVHWVLSQTTGDTAGRGDWKAGMGTGLCAGEAVTAQDRALEQEDPAEGMVGRKDWLAVFDTQ